MKNLLPLKGINTIEVTAGSLNVVYPAYNRFYIDLRASRLIIGSLEDSRQRNEYPLRLQKMVFSHRNERLFLYQGDLKIQIDFQSEKWLKQVLTLINP